MKKIISVILCLLMLMSLFTIIPITASAESYALFLIPADNDPADKPVTSDTRADADGDGEVTIFDATRIQRYLAELIKEDEIALQMADADKDGEVTIYDATRIQRYLAELCTLDGLALDEYELPIVK